MYQVTGCIVVKNLNSSLRQVLIKSLTIEAQSSPDPKRGQLSVRELKDSVLICFDARDLSSARMFVNTYLGLLATVLDSVVLLGEKNGSKITTRIGE